MGVTWDPFLGAPSSKLPRIWATLTSEMLKLSRGGLVRSVFSNMAKICKKPSIPPQGASKITQCFAWIQWDLWHGMKKIVWKYEYMNFTGCHGDTSLGNMFWALFRAKALGRRKSWTTTIAVFGLQALAPVSLYCVGGEGEKASYL